MNKFMLLRKITLIIALALLSNFAMARKGTIKGVVIDKVSGETLIGATVVLQGTTVGAMADFNGTYTLPPVEPGTYTLVCSFMSYETAKVENIEVKSHEEVVVNFTMKDASFEIESVQVVARANRESEGMMLVEQKKACGIKESIGASRLSQLGVSDVATATSKISGVSKGEGSGDVYIRGLGDRYLSTSMNELPIPSDDVEKKNINLNLFSTDVIQSVGINKTYSVENNGDQASGNVNIASKNQGKGWSFSIGSNTNSNVISKGFNNFRGSQNLNDITMGFYQNRNINTEEAVTKQSWNPVKRALPLGYDFALSYGNDWSFSKEKKLSLFATAKHSSASDYQEGIFKAYNENVLDNDFSDVEIFSTTYNTTALGGVNYKFNNNHSVSFNSLSIFKTADELYESGRNGDGLIMDKNIFQNQRGAFVRDQNTKTTRMHINQLLGKHKLSDKNTLSWALGQNRVYADEPNRIRNEMYINNADNLNYFFRSSPFDNRKFKQQIKDTEYNGFISNSQQLKDTEKKKLKINGGVSFRAKERSFESQFVGVDTYGYTVASIDDLSPFFLNTDGLEVYTRLPDTYDGKMLSMAGYTSFDFTLNKLSGNLGVRYQLDKINVNWDVNNYVGRIGSNENDYSNILPSINLKYAVNDKHSARLVASKTVTLPELKELAPFVYTSPSGRRTVGNPDLKNSEDYNVDLKWEFFATRSTLFSATAFYKLIKDPISRAIQPGAAGNFTYANTGEKANIYGIEAEARFPIIKAKEEGKPKLDATLNATKMWTRQDLYKKYQYYNITETELEGASGFIFNGAISFSSNTENPFVATLSGNYSSDKIFTLGAPRNQASRDKIFNGEIVEKGFETIDLVLSKKVSKLLSIKLNVKNITNPTIEQTQFVLPTNGDAGFTDVVSSYKRGMNLGLSATFNF